MQGMQIRKRRPLDALRRGMGFPKIPERGLLKTFFKKNLSERKKVVLLQSFSRGAEERERPRAGEPVRGDGRTEATAGRASREVR